VRVRRNYLDEGGDEGISSNTDSAIRDYSPAVPPLLSRQQAWECFPGHTANKSVAITISITHGSHCKGQGGGSHRIPNYTPTAHLRIRPVKSRRPTDSEWRSNRTFTWRFSSSPGQIRFPVCAPAVCRGTAILYPRSKLFRSTAQLNNQDNHRNRAANGSCC
jgi:hypothetical protein